jgi:hypothetical protein
MTLLREKAFNNLPPEYEGTEIEGYCAYCLDRKVVRQRFIYLCEICHRIIRSYGVERAATLYLLNQWTKMTQARPNLSHILLKNTDPVIPMSYMTHREIKKDLNRMSNPDFVGVDTRTEENIFAIEMKTGKNPISKMSAFQLDVSDCDDILSFVERLRIPTYLFHVQVRPQYSPPTERHLGINAWWLSIFDMERCFLRIRIRFRERRPAAYYNRRCFSKLEDFPAHLRSKDFENIRNEIKRRIPILYIIEPKKNT